MTGGEFRAARIKAGLSYRKAAERLGVALGTIQNWEAGSSIPSHSAELIANLANGADLCATARVLGRLTRVLSGVRGEEPRGICLAPTSTPAAAIGALLNLARQHPRRFKTAEPEVEALMARIPEFPPRLLADQEGAFWLGYYGHGEPQAGADLSDS